jgi:predicted TPR repeat methyltransferase
MSVACSKLRKVSDIRRAELDFGCGIGRLTRALSPELDECYGVDVSLRMVRLA